MPLSSRGRDHAAVVAGARPCRCPKVIRRCHDRRVTSRAERTNWQICSWWFVDADHQGDGIRFECKCGEGTGIYPDHATGEAALDRHLDDQEEKLKPFIAEPERVRRRLGRLLHRGGSSSRAVGHAAARPPLSIIENEILTLHLPRTLSGWSDVPITTESICHVAGFAIAVGGVARQRCAWCGEVLATAHRANETGVEQVEFPAKESESLWQVGGYIRATSDGRAIVGIVWKDEIPPDACCSAQSQRS
jgi:hypothetical protein